MEARSGLLRSCGLLIAVAAVPVSGEALRVHPKNTRYLSDGTGRAVYLTGSHVWTNVQDWRSSDAPEPFDYPAFLDFLREHGHNFTRLWAWEHAAWPVNKKEVFISPLPFARTGPGKALDGKPKFDLSRFNEAYFERLDRRVRQAENAGIYVGVMLFEGWSVESKGGRGGDPYRSHPFHPANNINNIEGDPDKDGEAVEIHTLSIPAVTAIQENYVRKAIDTLNGRDNVIWEIANECSRASRDWQYHMIRLIKAYEAGKPKQHLVWMTTEWAPGNNRNNNRVLLESPAEVISPNSHGHDYKNAPPATDGRKVVLLDTDHLWGIGGNRGWVWKSFLRGYHPIFMDDTVDALSKPGSEDWEIHVRRAMGHTLAYARRMDLAATTPQEGGAVPCSSGYCLYAAGREYLAYQPAAGSFTLDLPPGRYSCEWFDPTVGKRVDGGSLNAAGGAQSFRPPFGGEAVLYVSREQTSTKQASN